MAGTATISSTFTIEFVPSNTAATVITNPGRSFRVIGVQVNNPTAGALNFTLTDGSANIINSLCGSRWWSSSYNLLIIAFQLGVRNGINSKYFQYVSDLHHFEYY